MPKKKKAVSKVLDGDLRVRVEQKELDEFIKKAERSTGQPYQMLVRQMIAAFNDNKLRIKPTEQYHTGILYKKF